MITPILTNHAYERWCERAWEASRETVEAYVLSPGRRQALTMGASAIPVYPEEVVLLANKGSVVTVLTLEQHRETRRKRDDQQRFYGRRMKQRRPEE